MECLIEECGVCSGLDSGRQILGTGTGFENWFGDGFGIGLGLGLWLGLDFFEGGGGGGWMLGRGESCARERVRDTCEKGWGWWDWAGSGK